MTGTEASAFESLDHREGRARLIRYGESLLIAASLAAVAVFVVVGIDRSIWQDEAATILISARPFGAIVEGLRHENNFPVYFFLVAFWMRLFGDSEIALRALSAIFYLAGGGVAYALGRRASSGTRGAWYAALFYLCSPLAIRQAQNIRMYSLLGMLSGLSLLAFIRVFLDQRDSRRARAFFLLVNATGILTHLWFAFVLIPQFLALAVFRVPRWRAWIAGIALSSLPFWLFWFRPFLDQIHNGATTWMPAFQPGVLIAAPLEFYGFLPSLVLYLAAAGAWALTPSAARTAVLRRPVLPLLFLVFVATLCLPLLACVVKPIYAPGRYLVVALPPLAALLGALLGSLMPRVLPLLLGFLLITAGIADQIAHRNDVAESELPPGQSDRVTARFLLDHAAPGDAIVFTSLTRAAADYYFHRAHAEHRFVEISFPAENAGHPGWADATIPPGRGPALQQEADVTARDLRQLAAAGRHIWYYHGGALPIANILRQKLDAMLPPPREHALWGPYHRRILEYPGPS